MKKTTRTCKKCKEEIGIQEKVCPNCGAKKKFPKWGIIIIVVLVLGFIGGLGETPENGDLVENDPKLPEVEDIKVAVIDFSEMVKSEVSDWCSVNNLNCNFGTSYSDTIPQDGFISQSVNVDQEVSEGTKIEVVYSIGIEVSREFKNALTKAESYSNMMHMSKQGIYDQLVSEYGERFPAEAAQYAVDNMSADFFANAVEKARSYRDLMSMSNAAIYDQLVSEYGEKFTPEEARYGVDNMDKE